MNRALRILVIAFLIPAFGSCIFAPKEKKDDEGPPTGSQYLPIDDPDAPDNVLHNLELSYNQRNYEEFRKLLDNTTGVFTFYLGAKDIKPGEPKQWGIGEELGKTQRMFDRSPPPGQPYASNIELGLVYGEEEWFAFSPPTHPDETWYEKYVEYRLTVQVGPTTYTQNKLTQALFWARFVEVDGQMKWQITAWRDDV
jgi:hypothetical protein